MKTCLVIQSRVCCGLTVSDQRPTGYNPKSTVANLANIYLFQVNNKNSRCENKYKYKYNYHYYQ